MSSAGFDELTPDAILDAVEPVLGERMSGLARPLPSYINRVYDIESNAGTRYIAKFYRPGRWTRAALLDEHAFLADCAAAEIPAVAPLAPGGRTLHELDGLFFAIFPKRLGRQFEINTDEDWVRAGRLLGRLHTVAAGRNAPNRIRLHPEASFHAQVRHLVDGGFVTPRFRTEFEDLARAILELSAPHFDEADIQRIHGDCHRGNLLDRPGEGLVLIDFDDMMMGPPIQDLWLLLPDRLDHCRREFNLLLAGYEEFREFDDTATRLIEPLRAMRIVYFLAWCSHQAQDYKFRHDHPHWGTDAFWQRETADLATQLNAIRIELS